MMFGDDFFVLNYLCRTGRFFFFHVLGDFGFEECGMWCPKSRWLWYFSAILFLPRQIYVSDLCCFRKKEEEDIFHICDVSFFSWRHSVVSEAIRLLLPVSENIAVFSRDNSSGPASQFAFAFSNSSRVKVGAASFVSARGLGEVPRVEAAILLQRNRRVPKCWPPTMKGPASQVLLILECMFSGPRSRSELLCTAGIARPLLHARECPCRSVGNVVAIVNIPGPPVRSINTLCLFRPRCWLSFPQAEYGYET